MRFLIDLMHKIAQTGTEEQVAELLVSCDHVLQKETQADKELVESFVTCCNRRLAELQAGRSTAQKSTPLE